MLFYEHRRSAEKGYVDLDASPPVPIDKSLEDVGVDSNVASIVRYEAMTMEEHRERLGRLID